MKARFETSALVLLVVVVAVTAGTGCQRAPVAREAVSLDLEPFLKGYFQAWSQGRFDVYEACFVPKAVIMYVRGGAIVSVTKLSNFIAQQRRIVMGSPVRLEEVMTSFRAHEDRQGASVLARWKLMAGSRKETGVDLFSLVRTTTGKWAIAALVFYKDPGQGI